MKKLSIALILALCLSLTGCSLLREDESGDSATEDRLVGVYITSEHLDTFDIDSYISDNISSLANGGEVSAEDAAKYSGRIYAEVKDGTAIFPVEGMAIISARFGDGNESYIGSQRGDCVVGGGTHVTGSDNTDGLEISGTIYVPANESLTVFCNPVYQEPDGDIYLVGGQGMGSDGAGSMKQTMSASIDPHGDERGYSMSIDVTIEPIYASDKLVVLYYAEDGSLMSREEYVPGELPGELASGGGAYVVIEDYTRDYNNEPIVERTLLAPGDTDGFLSFTLEPGSPWFTPHSTIVTE